MPGRVDLNSLMPRSSILQNSKAEERPRDPMESFSEVLSRALGEVNDLRNQSSALTKKLVTGEIDNIHEVMIAAQKGGIALDLTMEIRNKVMQAYDKMMQMR